jgi:hypothetical protein
MIDLYQLAKYAEQEGLYYKPIIHPKKFDVLLDLLNPNTAAVMQYNFVLEGIQTKKPHILALIRPSNNEIQIIDFPKSQSVSISDFLKIDLGNCGGLFVLSKTPFPSQNNFIIILLASAFLGLFILFSCLKLLRMKKGMHFFSLKGFRTFFSQVYDISLSNSKNKFKSQ